MVAELMWAAGASMHHGGSTPVEKNQEMNAATLAKIAIFRL
jgi:hypothetical protein